MKQLMRRFSRVADSSTATTTSSLRRRIGKVPSGHVPVFVGEEMERFSVSADLLNHPIFIKLLNRSAQEYGYNQKGVLHIPCHLAVFEFVLHALRSGTHGLSAELIDQI